MLRKYLQEGGDVNGPAGLDQWGMEMMGSGDGRREPPTFFFSPVTRDD